MNKGSIVFIVVGVIALLLAGIFFMKNSADNAFKTVDESLKKSSAYIDSANKKLMDSLDTKLKK